MQDINTSYRALLAGMILIACLVIAGMIYVIQLSDHAYSTHTAAIKSVASINNNMDKAHLLLEEILSGDKNESPLYIQELFQLTSADFHTLEHSEEHGILSISHLEMGTLPRLHQEALITFKQLVIDTNKRLSLPDISAAGSASDQHYDVLFDQFESQMHKISNVLHASLTSTSKQLKKIETIIVILSLVLMITMIWITINFSRRQKRNFKVLLHAERVQHSMEEKYRALIEQSPLSMQLMNPNGTIIHVNKAWEELWGITPDILTEYNIFQDPLVQKSGLMDMMTKGFMGEEITTTVTNYNPKNIQNINSPFTDCFVRTHIYPVKNINATIEQIIITYEDVTESYLQNAFRLGQNKILNQISNPSSSLQDTLRELVLFVENQTSGMVASILLLDESGKHLIDAAGPHLPDTYRQAIDGTPIGPKVGSCGTAAYTGELVVVSNINTDPLWEDFKELALSFDLQACWSQPIKDSKGKVLGTFAMYYQDPLGPNDRDINLIKNSADLASNAIVHKQSMMDIITSESELAKAQKMAHIGSWKLNLNTNVLTWSDEIYAIFDLDKDSFGASYEAFLQAIHPDDREMVNDTYTKSLATQQPYEINHRLLMSDGSIKYVVERCESSFDYEGNPLISSGTVQDVTATVSTQKENERVQHKMEHVQRLESLGVLAGGIAHDFNNILTAVLGNTGLASHKLPATSPVHHYLDNITSASQKAADLCKQMLAYSGKGKFIVKPVLLTDIIDEMGQLLHVTIAKNIVLRFDTNKQTPAIDADVTQMQQVIMNLVINASEAIEGKSGAITLSTGVVRVDKQYLSTTFIDESLEEGAYVYLEVSDTGCGMNHETKGKIFEPFFTTKFTGRGLGMAAILGIIRGHNGAIKVYTEEGKGSTFKILFPCSKHESVRLQQSKEKKSYWSGKGTVLVIDDEETIREVATSILEDMGMKAMTANDGIEGTAVFQKHHKDISAVLLDMTMPRMGGEDAFTELCRIDPDAKVILSSGYNEQDATNRFAGKGLAGFLQKPYTPEQLSEKLADIFNKT